MGRIIIGIHGLGNKPPRPLMERWWIKSMYEGLSDLKAGSIYFKFVMAYWADILYDKPLNPLESNEKSPYFLEDPYTPRQKYIPEPTPELRKKINDYIEKQLEHLMLNKDFSINFSRISDLIIRHYFKDLDRYYAIDTTVRHAIRKRLSDLLHIHRHDTTMIIAHSMGSIIAFDVLLQLPPEISIDTLITIGSPLGIAVIKGKMMAEKRAVDPNVKEIITPDSIRNRWINLADIEDKVALDYDLSDDYLPNKFGVKPAYQIVVNDYYQRNKRNPHKAYGYLRTPQLAAVLNDFITSGRKGFIIWWLKRWGRIANRMFL
jgi:hypothetical protein